MKSSGAKLETPLARARGIGSAKHGSGHWWTQRMTALLLAVTVPWFIWLLLSSGGDYTSLRASLAQPFHVTMLMLLVVGVFWHAQLGLQVVVEDYVHAPATEIALQALIKLACLAAGLASLVAIGRIALGS